MAMVDAMGPYYAAIVRFALITSGLVFAIACDRRPADLPPPLDEFPMFQDKGCAPAREDRVACTLDGDTFDVGACGDDVGERIRMLGINAPEIAHEAPAECYGDIAGTALREMLDGRTVQLSFDYECFDRYGRTLAYVYVDREASPIPIESEDTGGAPQSFLVNEWMLQQGFARLAPEDWTAQDIRLLDTMVAAEQRAREQGIGLWGACANP